MAEQRLPTVDADDGAWGTILNQYIAKEHYNSDTDLAQATSENGGHKTITIQPGTTVAGRAPLKFVAGGALLTAVEAGAVEFDDSRLYLTTGTTRKAVATYAHDGNGAAGDMYFRDGSGNFVKLTIGGNNYTLGSNGTTPVWVAPGGSGLNQQQVMAISSMRM